MRSLGPTGTRRKRWTMPWKSAHNAFLTTFEDVSSPETIRSSRQGDHTDLRQPLTVVVLILFGCKVHCGRHGCGSVGVGGDGSPCSPSRWR
jgi:hypothetical protein